MNRRQYLAAAGLAGVAGTAGCLGGVGVAGSADQVTLSEPDRQYDSADVPYAAWGERVPDVAVPDAFTGEPVNVRDLPGIRYHTFFFANCTTLCPILEARLRELQIHSIENGYADAVSFYPITFDPERDTAERLRREADEMNVDLGAGNWHYLRPETTARAEAVVTDAFGVFFERAGETDGQYMYNHPGIVQLVNGDGYVERAYRVGIDGEPSERTMLADLRRLRTGGGGLL